MSFSERRQSLLNYVSSAYTDAISKSTQKSKVNKSAEEISLVRTQCGGPACSKCMDSFVSSSILNSKNQTSEELAIINNVRNTACSGSCVCNISNITENSTIVLSENATVSAGDFNLANMVAQIKASMQAKYGSNAATSADFNSDTTTLINSINDNVTQTINQGFFSMSAIDAKGAGYKLKGIDNNMVVNAVMSAVASSCSKTPGSTLPASKCGSADPTKPNYGAEAGCTCAIQTLNSIITNDMQKITSLINKDVLGDFKQVWKSVKMYVIIMASVIGGLLLLMVGLLIYRAYKSG
jgi:hypothetical protein